MDREHALSVFGVERGRPEEIENAFAFILASRAGKRKLEDYRLGAHPAQPSRRRSDWVHYRHLGPSEYNRVDNSRPERRGLVRCHSHLEPCERPRQLVSAGRRADNIADRFLGLLPPPHRKRRWSLNSS